MTLNQFAAKFGAAVAVDHSDGRYTIQSAEATSAAEIANTLQEFSDETVVETIAKLTGWSPYTHSVCVDCGGSRITYFATAHN